MISIVFESHSTSLDNENQLTSGHNDVKLSAIGMQQAKELGERYKNDTFAAIFCSDLQRSYMTAELAFGNKFHIIQDERLRECDYGLLTQSPSEELDPVKPQHIHVPFPGGESYEQTAQRMKLFLENLFINFDKQRIMIIGHRATQYGLEHWINNKSLSECVTAEWHWQPGWVYLLQA